MTHSITALPIPLLLLASAGLAFALTNDKIPGVAAVARAARAAVAEAEAAGRPPNRAARFVVDLLHCTFCTGVHAGWIVWASHAVAFGGVAEGDPLGEGIALAIYAIASGIACYGLDELIAALERSGGGE